MSWLAQSFGQEELLEQIRLAYDDEKCAYERARSKDFPSDSFGAARGFREWTNLLIIKAVCADIPKNVIARESLGTTSAKRVDKLKLKGTTDDQN